ncbi:MAG: tRNA (guanosine(37)-N1)-methyltransferase TrmD [Candidatus Omnitrophica bacterium]|nr:tRNA (guanosine(37)-N1)-methyltransferase TrmD [Candidatus Omnitrophota bacterium]
MKIDILTLFPDMFGGVFGESMIKIARQKGLVEINIHNLRKWTEDRHRTADDKPYGGGPGMVMKVEPVYKALEELKSVPGDDLPMTVLITPQGELFRQPVAKALSKAEHIIFVCGHYEGVDERIRSLVDMELSIGDYILTCGELPAMVICDSIIRLIPGVLGDEECLRDESFEEGLLEYPQYTRPSEFMDMRVPEVLLSGDPKKIGQWRREKAIERTRQRRPDLMEEIK